MEYLDPIIQYRAYYTLTFSHTVCFLLNQPTRCLAKCARAQYSGHKYNSMLFLTGLVA